MQLDFGRVEHGAGKAHSTIVTLYGLGVAVLALAKLAGALHIPTFGLPLLSFTELCYASGPFWLLRR